MLHKPAQRSHLRCALALGLACTSCCLVAQPARSADDSKAEIARLEDRWLKAIDNSDIATLGQILADDFLRPAPTAGQFITRTQLLAYYRSHKPSAPAGNRHIEDLSVTVYSNIAIARGRVVNRDAPGRIASTSLFTDVFVNRKGQWQAVSAQENAAETPSSQ